MSEIGILMVTSIVLVSLGVAFIIFMTKYFKTMKEFFEEEGKKSEELNKELEEIKAKLLLYEKGTLHDLVHDVTHNESENKNPPKVLKDKLQNSVYPKPQHNSGSITIHRNLRADEIPDNLQRVKILEAEKVVNGKKIRINPEGITLSNPGETVRINLHTNTKKNDGQ